MAILSTRRRDLTRILVIRYSGVVPGWAVVMAHSVIDDLRALGRKEGRAVLKAATARLSADPLAESRNLKTLRPNPVAQRELRLFGVYRVLFNVDSGRRRVVIVLAGEKRGESLVVQGKRYTAHENHSTE